MKSHNQILGSHPLKGNIGEHKGIDLITWSGPVLGAALLGGSEKAGSILVLFLRGWRGIWRAKRESGGWGGGAVADGGGTEVV